MYRAVIGWHNNASWLMVEIDTINCSLMQRQRKKKIIFKMKQFREWKETPTWFVPRLSSATLFPFAVSNTRISVPRSLLVASRVPCKFNDIQLMVASCAVISNGAFSVLAKSTIWTWPVRRPGKASNDLLLFGQSTHSPSGFWLVSKTCNCCGWVVNVYTLMIPSVKQKQSKKYWTE